MGATGWGCVCWLACWHRERGRDGVWLVGLIQASVPRLWGPDLGCTTSLVLCLLYISEETNEVGASSGTRVQMYPSLGEAPQCTEAALDLAQACQFL